MQLRHLLLVLGALPCSAWAFGPTLRSIRSTRCCARDNDTSLMQRRRCSLSRRKNNYKNVAAPRSSQLHVLRASSRNSEDEGGDGWDINLRRSVGAIASVGALETACLTYNKLIVGGGTATMESLPFCGTTGGNNYCGSVLTGPYSVFPGTEIPLALLGFVAYASVASLAFYNKGEDNEGIVGPDDDRWDESLLLGLTSAMGVFSLFLMILLFGVLEEFCAYCVASATFSITMATLSWWASRASLETKDENPGLGGGMMGLIASIILLVSVPTTDVLATSNVNFAGTLVADASSAKLPASILLASKSSSSNQDKGQAPPPILSSSSPRALQLSSNLQALNARFYGAYWCSHCYEQKERLGKEAMDKIPYIECSKDGQNSKTTFCKERDVPGYPTWEINGKLYPGERDLDELEEIIEEIRVK